MGFQFKTPRINIAFEPGHEYHGLEVTLRKLTLQEFLDINGIGEVQDMHAGHQLKTMGEKLLSWNLEDEDGNPVPATSESVLRQDKDLMIAICEAWLGGLRGVSAPLEQPSPDTETSLEASIPMDVPSESLAS
ncbi:hypothetical protein ABT071_13995 [Streptomyces sp. NPDC002506]|uniref:hypothetical protein n=1 Tax=Streptomyces sp. NPDC002506 TaxID=3154536 RepID=UPI0033272805